MDKKPNEKVEEITPEIQAMRRLLGFFLLAFTVMPALSILTYDWHDISWISSPANTPPSNAIGLIGAWSVFFGYHVFGLAFWIFPVFMLVYSLMLLYGKALRMHRRLFWMALFVIALCGVLQLNTEALSDILFALNLRPNAGGAVGYFTITRLLEQLISPVGSAILMAITMLFSVAMLVGVRNLLRWIVLITTRIGEHYEARRLRLEEKVLTEEQERQTRANLQKARAEVLQQKQKDHAATEGERQQQKRTETLRRQMQVAAEAVKPRPEQPPPKPRERQTAERSKTLSNGNGTYRFPTTELLDPVPASRAEFGDIEANKQLIVDTLKEFKIDVEVTHVEQGPVVTQYELLPAPGTPVTAILSRQKDLELHMKAMTMRIQAPIPGKGVIGIELPNPVQQIVTLREILEGPKWNPEKMAIPLALGKDAGGGDLIVDLADLPHLLVAGSTGSGKSVCLNAILTSLLICRAPDELKLILVDPKHVEFALYENLPHLLVPIINEPKKVEFGLRWAITEMEKRYKLLMQAKVRSIKDYNSRGKRPQEEFLPLLDVEAVATDDSLPNKLPYIVIVIDEVADIMKAATSKDIENYISRLTAKSRAVGIHLILATQRPTVDVITGTIKSNIPGRIALKVVQKNDSRTILDEQGAEYLIGRGDMLFRNPKTNQMVRSQSAWVSESEIIRIVDFISNQKGPEYDESFLKRLDAIKEADPEEELNQLLASETDPPSESEGNADTGDGGDYKQALVCLRDTQRASTSSLQRRLGWGYNRAARMMDELEAKGIVGPPNGAGPREILVDLNELVPDELPDLQSEAPRSSEENDDVKEEN